MHIGSKAMFSGGERRRKLAARKISENRLEYRRNADGLASIISPGKKGKVRILIRTSDVKHVIASFHVRAGMHFPPKTCTGAMSAVEWQALAPLPTLSSPMLLQ